LSIRNLSFTYEDASKPSLTNVNFDVPEGEFLLVTGATGSGKTSLCACINGLIPHSIRGAYAGTVAIDNKKIVDIPESEVSTKVGTVFQDPDSQILTTTVEEEVAFGPENLGVPTDDLRKRVDYALGVVGLQEMRDRSPHTLSGGQKQRLAIASALSMLPDILVLDEPTAQLDPKGTEEVFRTAKFLNTDQGKTVVMVEHKLDDLLPFADRVIVLDEGKIRADGRPDEVFSNKEIVRDKRIRVPQLISLFDSVPMLTNRKPPLTVSDAVTLLKDLRAQSSNTSRAAAEPVGFHNGDSTGNAIEVSDLTFRYPSGVTALSGINLKISRGECVAIIGENGSGKTTLVKHFNGLLRPTSGTVKIYGENIGKTSVAKIASRVGYAFQNPDHQIFLDYVYDEVAFGPRNLKSANDVDGVVKKCIEAVGLEGREKDFTFTLGLSERRRLAIAAVLAMEPSILILDEPTAGLDQEETDSVMEVAKRVHDQGKTVIIISHDMTTVLEYAERTIVLCRGQVLLDDTTANVFSKPKILQQTSVKPPPLTTFFEELGGFTLFPRTVAEASRALAGVLEEDTTSSPGA
jgi:energy-coupling factor transporter ATP-binding protein EcfA2